MRIIKSNAGVTWYVIAESERVRFVEHRGPCFGFRTCGEFAASSEDRFAQDIAAALAQAHAQGDFGRLVLIAPGSLVKSVCAALPARVRALVVARLRRGLVDVPNACLSGHLESAQPCCTGCTD